MEEREFFNETTETRTHNLTCPKCGQAAEYKVTWVVRRKRPQLPRNADASATAQNSPKRSRTWCAATTSSKLLNMRCRKPFEITGLQSLAFLND